MSLSLTPRLPFSSFPLQWRQDKEGQCRCSVNENMRLTRPPASHSYFYLSVWRVGKLSQVMVCMHACMYENMYKRTLTDLGLLACLLFLFLLSVRFGLMHSRRQKSVPSLHVLRNCIIPIFLFFRMVNYSYEQCHEKGTRMHSGRYIKIPLFIQVS